MRSFSFPLIILICQISVIEVAYGYAGNISSDVCGGCFGRHSNESTVPSPGYGDINLNLSGCELNSLQCIRFMCEEGLSVTSINASWNYIKDIRFDDDDGDGEDCLWQNVSLIDFSSNDIYVLQEGGFYAVNALRRLNVSRNHIYKIEAGAFDGISHLQALDLSENNLPGVHRDVFNSLLNLKRLSLAGNKILYIHPGSFVNLEFLEILDLSDNRISILDNKAFFGLKNLQQLYLGGNKLAGGVFEFLGVFKRLNTFDVSRNKLSSLEQNAFYKYNVRKIDFSHNRELQFILQSTFLDMPLLASVDLSGNSNLYFIHDQAFINIPNLTLINFTDTKIKFLPLVSNATMIDTTRTKLRDDCYTGTLFNHTIASFNSNYDGSVIAQYSDIPTESCGPSIVSSFREKISVVLGETLSLACLAVGMPWPGVKWQRDILVEGESVFETTKTDYFLKLHIGSLNDEGNYRCVADSNNRSVIKNFFIKVLRIDIGIRVLVTDASSIVVTWNRTHYVTQHVILYRAFEETTVYHVQRFNEYWKLFRIAGLKQFTQYEVCIASRLDINDKNCVRTATTREMETYPGIRHDTGVIAVLTISGFVFGLAVLATLYKCVHKLRIITRQHVFIVNSESRETFGDTTEATFTYENQFSDFLLDNEQKTEF